MDFMEFMKENALSVPNEKVLISERFLGADGKPVPFELRAISPEEDDALRQEYTKMVRAPGKAGQRGQMLPRLDTAGYTAALAAACTVYPSLTNAALQDSYGVKNEVDLLRRMLTPGELSELTYEAQHLCGFDVSLAEKVDEAKN